MSFSSLGLSRPLLKTVAAQQYTNPYPIQEQAIPAILRGRDILGIAQTGSGKTASFVLPILEYFQGERIGRNRFVKALVLVPTRELAVQVAEVFQTFGANLPRKVKTLAVYGGVSINPQMIALQNTEIVVATPGRLLDLVSSNALRLSAIEMLVLDEADKMLNLGFEEEMQQIFELLPTKRQTLLFSATLGDAVDKIQANILKSPLRIDVTEAAPDLETIRQVAYRIAPERKGPFLRYLIKSQNMRQVLVFVSSTRTADNVVGKLNKNGIKAIGIHGDKAQTTRLEALQQFKDGKATVLVSTDLLSRGIDIQELPFVINYELPRSPKDYVHRIGRTGRAGAEGDAITLICPEDEHHFKIIQKKMGKRVEIRESEGLDLTGE